MKKNAKKIRSAKGLYLLLLVLMVSAGSYAQEGKFHALFLTKFAENVRWPGASNTYVIGVAGNSSVYDYLVSFTKAKPNLSVIKLNSASEVKQCQIVFIPRSADKDISDFVDNVGNASILIVSENDRLTGKGSDIGFFLENGKMRFLVSKASLESKNLVMGTNLLGRGKVL